MRNRVVVFQEHSMNFDLSSRPILQWIRCLGIPLLNIKSLKKKGYWHYILFTLFTAMCYVLNVGFHSLSIIETITSNSSRYSWTTSGWNDAITAQNYRFATIGAHTALLFFTSVHWANLIRTAKSLESLLKPKDYRRIRRASLIGVVCMFLVCYYRCNSDNN